MSLEELRKIENMKRVLDNLLMVKYAAEDAEGETLVNALTVNYELLSEIADILERHHEDIRAKLIY